MAGRWGDSWNFKKRKCKGGNNTKRKIIFAVTLILLHVATLQHGAMRDVNYIPGGDSIALMASARDSSPYQMVCTPLMSAVGFDRNSHTYWRPAANILYAILAKLYATTTNAKLLLIVGYVFHVLVGVLSATIVYIVSKKLTNALIALILVTISSVGLNVFTTPSHFQEILLTAFTLVFVYVAHTIQNGKGKPTSYVALILSYTAALLTKESAIILGVATALATISGRIKDPKRAEHTRLIVVIAAMILLYFAVRTMCVPKGTTLQKMIPTLRNIIAATLVTAAHVGTIIISPKLTPIAAVIISAAFMAEYTLQRTRNKVASILIFILTTTGMILLANHAAEHLASTTKYDVAELVAYITYGLLGAIGLWALIGHSSNSFSRQTREIAYLSMIAYILLGRSALRYIYTPLVILYTGIASDNQLLQRRDIQAILIFVLVTGFVQASIPGIAEISRINRDLETKLMEINSNLREIIIESGITSGEYHCRYLLGTFPVGDIEPITRSWQIKGLMTWYGEETNVTESNNFTWYICCGDCVQEYQVNLYETENSSLAIIKAVISHKKKVDG